MNKIAIITDQHFGARADSQTFLDFYEQFYRDCFFPKISEENVKTLLILGDTFDRRKYINFNTLQRSKLMFFDVLRDMNIKVFMLAGNHDTYFKNTNEINSIKLLLKEYDNIVVIDEPTTIQVDELNDMLMVPWMCSDNYIKCLDAINNSKSVLCAGHFEIDGFSMYRGHPCEEGLSRDIFRRFEYTFSGHYHHKSNSNGIFYLGNPYELTWQDYDDDRGFHTFDLDTRTLTFHKNPYVMFYRILYDDSNSMEDFNYDQLRGKYVKVVVVNKSNPYLFDRFMDRIYSIDPFDVKIVEDFSDTTEGLDEELINQAEDTLTLLNKYVDGLGEINMNSTKIKNILRELYLESVNSES